MAQKQSWALGALACAVDTSTPTGDAMANMLATFAQFERRVIAQHTREGLAVKKADGARLGADRPCRRWWCGGYGANARAGTRSARSRPT
jgi:DNA invertase Pin-like site-specific DNA recombinase